MRLADRGGSSRYPHLRDAGVTSIEYALVLALVVSAVVGSLAFLQSATEDDLDERATNAGAPDLGTGSSLPPTTAPPTSGPPPPTGGTGPASITVTSSLSGTKAKIGSDWIATVTITVTDTATGDTVQGVAVTAAWSAGITGLTSCITGGAGSCAISTNEIDRVGGGAVTSVTLSLTGLSGAGVVYTALPAPITVTKP